MIREILTVVGLATSALCYTAPAVADDIHLCDISQVVTCDSGSVVPTSSTTAYVFGNTGTTGDTLHLAILTPLPGGSGNFNSGANLWSVLGLSPTQVFPNFASTVSQELGATGIVAGSFSASTLSMGNWTGTVTSGQMITLPNEPVGTIFIAYDTDANGNLIAVSPWSSDLINVPEPASLTLLGAGLLAMVGLVRRRSKGN